MQLLAGRKNRSMTSEHTFTPAPQSPTNTGSNPTDAAGHLTGTEAATSGTVPSPQHSKSPWRRLANPLYIFSATPWTALAVLVAQGLIATAFISVTASVIGLLVVPLLAVGFGYYERWRLEKTGFGLIPNGHVNFPDSRVFDQLLFRYKELATWREVGSLLITTLWGSVAGVLMVLQVTAIGSLAWLGYLIGQAQQVYRLSEGVNIFDSFVATSTSPDVMASNGYLLIDPALWWVPVVVIPFALILFAYLNGVLVASGASLSKLVLSPRPEEFERQTAKLAESRTKIVDAFEGERRRIERNLHDGVQQELVNLNLRLGLAELEAKNLATETNSERAGVVHGHIVQARTQLSHAQTTLRDTVRGIFPAVLEDHGLRAALEELTRHSVLPVQLAYDAPVRLPRDIERTAYYTVNEALTNTVKHADASRLTVTVQQSGDSLVVISEDDGRGGAALDAGTGLSGLTERAAVIGGTVEVTSPASGGTRVTLTLPLLARS